MSYMDLEDVFIIPRNFSTIFYSHLSEAEFAVLMVVLAILEFVVLLFGLEITVFKLVTVCVPLKLSVPNTSLKSYTSIEFCLETLLQSVLISSGLNLSLVMELIALVNVASFMVFF